MKPRLLLSGYFGCGNLGDDAIMLGFLEGIKDKQYEAMALCGSPDRMMSSYGLRGVPRMDFSSVKNAIDECDAVVFPGGSIFQDVTSVRSVAYYYKVCSLAKKRGKKLILLGQGVGPLNGFFGRRLTGLAFNAADAIAVRDPDSARLLQSIGVKQVARAAADMAFLMPEPPKDEAGQFGMKNMKTVILSVRPSPKDKGKTSTAVFSELSRLLFQNGYMPVLLEMDLLHDRATIDAISKANGGKIPDIKNLTSPIQIQQRLARVDSVIAMRLHAGILAATVNVPPFMVSYDPKVGALANLLGYQTAPNIEGLNAGRLMDLFTAFQKDRERIANQLPARRQALADQARENIRVLENVLGV